MINSLITDVAHMLNGMSPYILLGFLLSGLLHEFMPRGFYTRYLSGQGFRPVFMSALFGIPLPLCSCGVIPTAMGLRREGVSHGATVSFLIATPQTVIDSFNATYSLMGLPFALVRPFVALVTAIFGGSLINRMVPEKVEAAAIPHEEAPDHHHGNLLRRIGDAMKYGFVDMMADIGKWLVIGLIIAGIITTALPDEWFTIFRGNSLLSMAAVLLLSIPMYLCATGSIPIAVALVLKGLSPGTALVMLMAGPACNMASILVIRKVLGSRTMALYLLSIILGAVSFGLAIDYLLPREWFTERLIHMDICCETGAKWLYQSCTVVLIALLVYALVINRFLHKKHCHCCEDHSCEAEQGRILVVKGMNCNHCVANVKKVISETTGVNATEVSLEEGQAIVHGADFDPEAVLQAVKSLGFEAEWKSNE